MERLSLGAASVALPRRAAALSAALIAAAAVAWIVFAGWMGNMEGVGADLTAAAFAGSWALMMAAMMLPSMTPVVALYDRMRAGHGLGAEATAAFVAGYLATWVAAGLAAYGLVRLGDGLLGDTLAWEEAGRPLAGAVVLLAAAYQLSPLKERCLTHCRSPLGFLLSHWRPGRTGAIRVGMTHGAWCVGCCWGLMATLFAVGLMSIGWMAAVALLIAFERLVPGGAWTRFAVAGVLALVGLALLVAPDAVPDAGGGGMGDMGEMTMPQGEAPMPQGEKVMPQGQMPMPEMHE
jgi:predicted metal-binding membrane protein